MSAHAEALHEHHGPPEANQSSRVDARTLGMLMFIGSEIMLFGSFFAAYFFVRVVNPSASAEWPPEPYHFPVFVAGVNTAILVTSSFTMHWALQSIKRGERAGFLAGMVLTFVMGLAFLLTQVVVFLAKVFLMCSFQILVRWSLPRFRYDQLLAFAWKFMFPLALANLAVTAVAVWALRSTTA